jgi:hypothetical protein
VAAATDHRARGCSRSGRAHSHHGAGGGGSGGGAAGRQALRGVHRGAPFVLAPTRPHQLPHHPNTHTSHRPPPIPTVSFSLASRFTPAGFLLVNACISFHAIIFSPRLNTNGAHGPQRKKGFCGTWRAVNKCVWHPNPAAAGASSSPPPPPPGRAPAAAAPRSVGEAGRAVGVVSRAQVHVNHYPGAMLPLPRCNVNPTQVYVNPTQVIAAGGGGSRCAVCTARKKGNCATERAIPRCLWHPHNAKAAAAAAAVSSHQPSCMRRLRNGQLAG